MSFRRLRRGRFPSNTQKPRRPGFLSVPLPSVSPRATRGHAFYLLVAVGGLLMTVTAGGGCVDLAVRTAQNPAMLRRLSNALIRLVGRGRKTPVASSLAKQKLKRLYFTDSLCSLLDETRAAQLGSRDSTRLIPFPGSPETPAKLQSTSANCISAKRCRIYYILICGGSDQAILKLCMGDGCSELKAHNPSNRLQWLVDFGRKAWERGDVIVVLVGGQTGQTSAKPGSNEATSERRPTRLALALSALSSVLLWMFLPHIAACAFVLFGWKVQQHVR